MLSRMENISLLISSLRSSNTVQIFTSVVFKMLLSTFTFKLAVRIIVSPRTPDLQVSDVSVFILHQANGKIIDFVTLYAKIVGVPNHWCVLSCLYSSHHASDSFYNNFTRVGNTEIGRAHV